MTDHPLYKYARFYTIETLRKWLGNANMSIVERRSTLYQVPGCVEQNEAPKNVPDEHAGFAVIVVRKNQAQNYHPDQGAMVRLSGFHK